MSKGFGFSIYFLWFILFLFFYNESGMFLFFVVVLLVGIFFYKYSGKSMQGSKAWSSYLDKKTFLFFFKSFGEVSFKPFENGYKQVSDVFLYHEVEMSRKDVLVSLEEFLNSNKSVSKYLKLSGVKQVKKYVSKKDKSFKEVSAGWSIFSDKYICKGSIFDWASKEKKCLEEVLFKLIYGKDISFSFSFMKKFLLEKVFLFWKKDSDEEGFWNYVFGEGKYSFKGEWLMCVFMGFYTFFSCLIVLFLYFFIMKGVMSLFVFFLWGNLPLFFGFVEGLGFDCGGKSIITGLSSLFMLSCCFSFFIWAVMGSGFFVCMEINEYLKKSCSWEEKLVESFFEKFLLKFSNQVDFLFDSVNSLVEIQTEEDSAEGGLDGEGFQLFSFFDEVSCKVTFVKVVEEKIIYLSSFSEEESMSSFYDSTVWDIWLSYYSDQMVFINKILNKGFGSCGDSVEIAFLFKIMGILMDDDDLESLQLDSIVKLEKEYWEKKEDYSLQKWFPGVGSGDYALSGSLYIPSPTGVGKYVATSSEFSTFFEGVYDNMGALNQNLGSFMKVSDLSLCSLIMFDASPVTWKSEYYMAHSYGQTVSPKDLAFYQYGGSEEMFDLIKICHAYDYVKHVEETQELHYHGMAASEYYVTNCEVNFSGELVMEGPNNLSLISNYSDLQDTKPKLETVTEEKKLLTTLYIYSNFGVDVIQNLEASGASAAHLWKSWSGVSISIIGTVSPEEGTVAEPMQSIWTESEITEKESSFLKVPMYYKIVFYGTWCAFQTYELQPKESENFGKFEEEKYLHYQKVEESDTSLVPIAMVAGKSFCYGGFIQSATKTTLFLKDSFYPYCPCCYGGPLDLGQGCLMKNEILYLCLPGGEASKEEGKETKSAFLEEKKGFLIPKFKENSGLSSGMWVFKGFNESKEALLGKSSWKWVKEESSKSSKFPKLTPKSADSWGSKESMYLESKAMFKMFSVKFWICGSSLNAGWSVSKSGGSSSSSI